MKNIRIRFGCVALAVATCAMMLLIGCSDDDGESSVSTVTRYAYKLNSNSSYHRVVKYVAVDNGDNTFEVNSVSYHYFAISNSDYKNRTGDELCTMVRTNAVEPDSSEEITLQNDTNATVNMVSGAIQTFHLHKGLRYTNYYYF